MGFLFPTPRRELLDGWTFFSMAKYQPLYVLLSPPGKGKGPIPFPLAGLPFEHVQTLHELHRDDPVPPQIVAGLLTLAPPSLLGQQFGPRR
jgi:hypothetical protein